MAPSSENCMRSKLMAFRIAVRQACLHQFTVKMSQRIVQLDLSATASKQGQFGLVLESGCSAANHGTKKKVNVNIPAAVSIQQYL